MYTKYCNVPKNEPNICPNVGWLPDFHEPQTILDATFNGKNILPSNNSNWPLLNNPKINAEMATAKKTLDPAKRYQEWGQIDKQVTERTAVPCRGCGRTTRRSSRRAWCPRSCTTTPVPGRLVHVGEVERRWRSTPSAE
jgi:hypothetical protein